MKVISWYSCLISLLSVLLESLASQTPLVLPAENKCADVDRIAIIGGGAAGTSAAFWIAKAVQRNGLAIEVDLFERNSYIGGRSTTVQPYGDEGLDPVELGGSVFVRANKHIWRATEEYGLGRFKFENDNDEMGIWDGHEFMLKMGGDKFYSSWWGKLKLLWRYGFRSPQRTQAAVSELVQSIMNFYTPTPTRFTEVSYAANVMGWTEAAAQSSLQYLRSREVGDPWSLEFVEAITRLNYGQDIDRMHALGGLVSLASEGASSVEGGDFQIYERFLEDSGASVFLNTTVISISRSSSPGPWLVQTDASPELQAYRAVILAAPFHSTGISFIAQPPIATVPQQPYVHLHVTILSTSAPSANATYFNLPPGSKVPEMVLTTYNGARQGGPAPEFNSLSYLRPVRTRNGSSWTNDRGEPEWVVKIFSQTRMSDSWLESMFDGKVGWVLRREWDAYPVLSPTTEFPPVELADGLYYVNAFEPLISTMETEILASQNAVDLAMAKYYNASVCKTGDVASVASDDFVYGWDC